LCFKACPVSAISHIEEKAGEHFISKSRFGTLVHAQLGIGEELSGDLVAHVRDDAYEIGKKETADYLIIDGPPGIGCTAIATITGVDIAVIISEPTQSGLHDMERSILLLEKHDTPAAVIINKWDLNIEKSQQIEAFCIDRGIKVIAKIPYAREFTHAMIEQKTIIEFAPESESAELLEKAWLEVLSLVSSPKY
jgi:MinD superfamily P-loop ATPase